MSTRFTPEGKEKAKVKAFLASIGAYQTWPVPSGYGRQGLDCFACIRGQFWGIEVKAKGGVPTPRQKQTLTEIINAGGWPAAGTAEEIINVIKDALRRSTQLSYL